MSFLGTGKYDECEYYLKDVRATTKYIQSAILQILHQQDQRIDEVCMFLTQEARELNWEGESKLQSELLELKKRIPFSIKEVNIEFADDIDTIWDTFTTIVETINDGDEIIFDITHSFRYQPMLALLALHFLRVTKEIDIKGVYYGVYDPRSEEKTFPILDLSAFAELQDWITNVYSFTKTGRVDALSDWLMKKRRMISREERATTIDIKCITNLSKAWKDLTDALHTNRSPDIHIVADKALKSIEELKQHEVRPVFKPLNILFTKVQESIEPMAIDDEILSGFAAIEWCMDHDLIQQAYTLTTELAFTAFCKKNGIDPRDDKKRKLYSRFFTAIVNENRKKNPERLDHPEIPNAHKIQVELMKYHELLESYNVINDNRNDINHAAWRKEYLSPHKLKTLFQSKYPIFKSELIRYLKANESTV